VVAAFDIFSGDSVFPFSGQSVFSFQNFSFSTFEVGEDFFEIFGEFLADC